jgi:copper chaperone CopZ
MPAHIDLGLTARNDLGLTDANASGGCGCGHGGGGCMCGGHGAGASSTSDSASASATSVVTELSVSGMTCGHCVKSVTEELAEIYGVNGVDVKLNPEGVSSVVVLSEAPLDKAHVAAAIEEAGYSLVSAPLSAD